MTTLRKSFIIAFTLTLVMVFFLPQASLAQTSKLDEVAAGTGLKNSGLVNIISNIIETILGFIGVIILILLIYAGFLWMTAGGSEDKVKKAKTIMKNAVIGLLIVVLSYAITTFVVNKVSGFTNEQQQNDNNDNND